MHLVPLRPLTSYKTNIAAIISTGAAQQELVMMMLPVTILIGEWDVCDCISFAVSVSFCILHLKSYQTDQTSVLTPAAGMEANENQCNQDPVSADEIELLCIGLREKPADFSTPYDYLCNLMKSPSETASDALTHSIMTRKSSNETLPLVGKPDRQKVFDVLSSILKKLSELDESSLANVIKGHFESDQSNEHLVSADGISADEIELLCIALNERPAGFSTPYDYLINAVMKSSNQNASNGLAHLAFKRPVSKVSNETLPLVAGQPTVPKLRELFSSIMKKLRALDESALATLVKDHSESAADISATSNTQNKIDDSVTVDQADDSSCILLKPTLIGEYYLSELYYYLQPFICASYSWILWCFEI